MMPEKTTPRQQYHFSKTGLLVIALCCFSPALSQVKYIDSLTQLLNQRKEKDSTYINLLNEIALTYWSISADSVLSLSKRSLSLARNAGYLKGQAEATKNIGVACWGKGDYTQALRYYQEAIPLAEKSRYWKGLSGCYNNIAILYVNQGKYMEALPNHEKALAMREKIGDKKAIATSLNNIGIIHEKLGHLTEALDYQLRALKMREAIHDEFGIAMSYNNLANLYGLQNQYDKSLDYQQSALQIREKLGDLSGVSQSMVNIGHIYSRQHQDSMALIYFTRALDFQESKLHEEYNIAHLLLSIADIYSRTGKQKEASDFYHRSQTKMLALQDSSGMTGVLLGLAGVKLQERQFRDALALAEQGLAIARKLRQAEQISESHNLLSTIFERMGNPTQALYHYKEFKIFSDQLVNSETKQKTTQLQAEYEFQKKESKLKEEQQQKEAAFIKTSNRQRLIIVITAFVLVSVSVIALLIVISRRRLKTAFDKLESAHTLINRQNEQLAAMNATHEQLLSIVSHDARAPLNSLQGMIHLLSQNAVSLEEAKKLFSSLTGQIGQVTNFMETLLHWVKNQFGNYQAHIAPVEIFPLTHSVIQLLSPIAHAKEISIIDTGIAPVTVMADQEMVRIMLRNLISNAIKFSHPQGSVQVGVTALDNSVKICVTDEGVGISQENMDKLLGNTVLSTQGTHAEVGTGIGIQLCKRLATLNGGQFGIESSIGKGSCFWFTLPAKIEHPVNEMSMA
jgi:signal transduction histidine kinase